VGAPHRRHSSKLLEVTFRTSVNTCTVPNVGALALTREEGTLAEVNSNYSMATSTTIIDPSTRGGDGGGDDRLLTVWLPILIAGLASVFGICVG